uniref:Fringe-like glycosyltransferase domain-containing protein n=1 Tax=Oryza nivara TaxID=4536 RepID=A0A0E0G7A7_ORYNI
MSPLSLSLFPLYSPSSLIFRLNVDGGSVFDATGRKAGVAGGWQGRSAAERRADVTGGATDACCRADGRGGRPPQPSASTRPSNLLPSTLLSVHLRAGDKRRGDGWFVMGDDDTVFFPDNMVAVLNKFDHAKTYYIGAPSESVEQDVMHSYSMAFGGGGFAISYPAA